MDGKPATHLNPLHDYRHRIVVPHPTDLRRRRSRGAFAGIAMRRHHPEQTHRSDLGPSFERLAHRGEVDALFGVR